MNDNQLVLIELKRKDWSRFRDVQAFVAPDYVVSSAYVPDVVKGLLVSQDVDEVENFYWKLENHVVVQGHTFEAAEHLVPVLLAALQTDVPQFVRSALLELLFQMVAYEPSQHEIDLGNVDLTNRCRISAREGIWTLYKLYLSVSSGDSDSAYQILERIEVNTERLEAFRRAKAEQTQGG